MKIVILRGGARPRRRRPVSPSTADRGVMAIGSREGAWVLVNMSPAVAHQLGTDSVLANGLTDAGVRAVVLTDAQVDHVGGLLSLRDGAPIELYATPAVFEELTTTLPVLPVLQHYCGVHWRVIPVAGDGRLASFRVDGMPEVEFTALATRMPALPHSAHAKQPRTGDSIALAVRDLVSGQRVFCAPGMTQFGTTEIDWMREADCLLVDSPAALASAEPAHDAPQWMDMLRGMRARRKVLFTHDGTGQRHDALADHGIELAYDGMEIEL